MEMQCQLFYSAAEMAMDGRNDLNVVKVQVFNPWQHSGKCRNWLVRNSSVRVGSRDGNIPPQVCPDCWRKMDRWPGERRARRMDFAIQGLPGCIQKKKKCSCKLEHKLQNTQTIIHYELLRTEASIKSHILKCTFPLHDAVRDVRWLQTSCYFTCFVWAQFIITYVPQCKRRGSVPT